MQPQILYVAEQRPPKRAQTRRFRSRGIDVEIREAPDRVELSLDGIPIEVELVDGAFHSPLANQFEGFSSVDEIVDLLLENEGRTWTLHGHICDDRCGPHGHHHDLDEGHTHDHGRHEHQ